MALNLVTLVPASSKAKEVVTADTVIEAINSNTTTINGGRIDTDSVFANRVFAENITYTGTITGGTTASGGIIQSKNYVTSGGTEGMIIDLVNGSIYIA